MKKSGRHVGLTVTELNSGCLDLVLIVFFLSNTLGQPDRMLGY